MNAERALVLLVQMTHGPIRADVLDRHDMEVVLALVGKGWAESGRSSGRAVFKLTKPGRATAEGIRDKVKAAQKKAVAR